MVSLSLIFPASAADVEKNKTMVWTRRLYKELVHETLREETSGTKTTGSTRAALEDDEMALTSADQVAQRDRQVEEGDVDGPVADIDLGGNATNTMAVNTAIYNELDFSLALKRS